MSELPATPKITYPSISLTGLTTNIAWMSADAFDACEVRIGRNDNLDSADIWQSGRIDTIEPFITTPALPGASKLYAFVRIHSVCGWSKWSEGHLITTPASPVVRITRPEQAGRMKSTAAKIEWKVESNDPVTKIAVNIDGKGFIEFPPDRRSIDFSEISEGVHKARVRASAGNKTSEDEVTFYVYKPEQVNGGFLYTLDLNQYYRPDVSSSATAARAFETLHIAAALQGVVNRGTPQLWLNFMPVDAFWLDKIRAKGAYLERTKLVPVETLEEAIDKFRDVIKGAVVWDPNLPCTSNIASTICGVENLLPIRYDESPGSMYDRLIRNGPKLRVVHNLVDKFTGLGKIPDSELSSTGSAKCDAYMWAKMQYIDSGKCNPREVGYWCDAFWLKAPQNMSLDNVGLTNADYIIARKGFICDLDVWTDEAPRDDPNQRHGLDRETFMEILRSCYKAGGGKMIHFCGFTPWAIKYTDHKNAGGKHGGVATEWETARIVSSFNGYMDADAIGFVGMANASVFSHCKLPDRLIQNSPPTKDNLESKGYMDPQGSVAKLNFIYHYLGDYDSAAWMYNRMPDIWRSAERGNVPSGWAFNPSLSDRMPPVFEWCYDTKTPADYFVSGDSGAGYINPTELLEPREPSGLPSGKDAWINHNIPYFMKFNYSIIGFLINGFCGQLTDESNNMFLPFSADGVMTQPIWMPPGKQYDHLLSNMPVAVQIQDISPPTDKAADECTKHGKPGEAAFLAYRCILQPPDWVKSVNDEIRRRRPECRYEPVDPYTYFYLLRHALGGKNEMRATYMFDTLPARVEAGQKVEIIVGIRNDAWDIWESEGNNKVTLLAGFGGRKDCVDIRLPERVEPGQAAVVTFSLTVPPKAGASDFYLELRRGTDGYFGDAGDLPWRKQIVIY